ncbi:unnamed protein product [Orchesella dallaii]|uniref:Xanthine dehydrogenase n=1 Tax=Orchesella dallaii TaxID=48710 RepID=A0ABP1PKL3_9HEXA
MVNGSSNSPVVFHINGEKHTVDGNSGISPNTALVDYIRDVADLKGTKVMCREGGCGACTVTAKIVDPNSGSIIHKSVNACLTPVLSCDGWDISTIESLGNKHEGYHVIQNRLVNFHGTQCGYCTPGMVMNMYGLMGSGKEIGMEDIEKNLDGNICRCTGYRPILDAFKSFANDASNDLKQKCADIEDCATCPMKKGNGESCMAQTVKEKSIKFHSGQEWKSPKTLENALKAANECNKAGVAFRIVAGNTSTGIFKNQPAPTVFIDVTGIPELKKTTVDQHGIILGGGTSLSEVLRIMREASTTPGLEYGKKVATHLERVANVSVRNNGTIGGNLMIKHAHNDFPSDVFVILETLRASIQIVSLKSGQRETVSVSLPDFLRTNMDGKLIKSISLPTRLGYFYRSFKITRRYQNAHAYVNAGFLFKIEKKGESFIVAERPRIVFGGVSGDFIHATSAEEYLEGKDLSQENTLTKALESLEKQLKPQSGALESSPKYRTHMAKALLYKTILEIIGKKANDKLQSGSSDLERIMTSGTQTYDAGNTETNLFKSVPKCESNIQASGEAEYTGDIPVQRNELYGAFVLSTVANGDISNIDASEALKVEGVERFVSASDIPGLNDVMKYNAWPSMIQEPVFAAKKISTHGQAIGLVLATSTELARSAAKLVKVTYENVTTPIVKIEQAIAKAKEEGTFARQTVGVFKTAPSEEIKVAHTVKGTCDFGSQYHFYMETQSVICHPREDGIDIYCCTQWMEHVQHTVGMILNIPSNSVNVQVRRLGGGFGGKGTRTTFVAAACAVATWVSRRPCRIVLDLDTNMSMIGKRSPYHIPYEVGFDDEGRIGSLKADLICDTGCSSNEATTFIAMLHIQNCYKAIGWEVGTHFVFTNTPSNTTVRAPGSVQSVAAIEWIMDHIGNYLKKDPLEIRMKNLLNTGDALLFGHGPPATYQRENMIPKIVEQMKSTADYEARNEYISLFNKQNRWKKRGFSVVPVRYNVEYFSTNYPVSLAIYHVDGHVAVSHGAIEMGQGINTKVIQAIAHGLQIPMDRIKVKPSNTFVGANAFVTAGSIASELAVYCATKACEQIRENLRPILEKLENPTWDKLIKEAHAAKVNLTASYTPTRKDDLKGYDVWVVCANEVEIDVLTGEYKILRTDVYEDVGRSLSPAIDMGQIEGGYIFGQGYWTTEKIIYDENTGKLLTNGTWDYKPPECKDIPQDFRVTLLSNQHNAQGVLGSKATGEPVTDAAFGVVLAMRNAIASARADAGNTDWFQMSGPVTPEDIAMLCLTDTTHLTV